MPIAPYSSRHRIDDLGDRTVITIPNRKVWSQILFYAIWLVGWSVGLAFAVTQIGADTFPGVFRSFLGLWLIGWVVGGISAIYRVVWMLLGVESIAVNGFALVLKRSLLGVGVPREYLSSEAKGMRLAASSGIAPAIRVRFFGASLGGSGTGMLAFDYGARTITFASEIDEPEAKEILEAIHQRYPQYRS